MAINVPKDSMMNREYSALFKQTQKTNIFYANNDTTAKQACLLSSFLGKAEHFVLNTTVAEFREMFFNIPKLTQHASKAEMDIYKFRHQAAQDLLDLENSLKRFAEPIKKKTRKVQGGCS